MVIAWHIRYCFDIFCFKKKKCLYDEGGIICVKKVRDTRYIVEYSYPVVANGAHSGTKEKSKQLEVA